MMTEYHRSCLVLQCLHTGKVSSRNDAVSSNGGKAQLKVMIQVDFEAMSRRHQLAIRLMARWALRYHCNDALKLSQHFKNRVHDPGSSCYKAEHLSAGKQELELICRTIDQPRVQSSCSFRDTLDE